MSPKIKNRIMDAILYFLMPKVLLLYDADVQDVELEFYLGEQSAY